MRQDILGEQAFTIMEFNKYLPTYYEILQIFLLIPKLKLTSFLFGYSDESRLAPVEKHVETLLAKQFNLA